jgi:soluble lytic murein transglycosylase
MMQGTPRRCSVLRRTSTWLSLLCASLPAAASAYDAEPLCVLQTPWSGEVSSSEALHALEVPCAPDVAPHVPSPAWSAPISLEESRAELARADAFMQEGKLGDALLALRVVEQGMPRVRDRVAMRRAELLMQLDRPADACDAFAIAERSLDRNVAAQARIERVRCLLEAGQRSGEEQLSSIMRRYPHMGDRAELRLTLARAREGWGDVVGAVAIYRSVDLDQPETPAASVARDALAAILARGERVRPLSASEQVDRAERLVLRGSVEAGRSAVEALMALPLPPAHAARAHLLAARVARVEGRWDDVQREVASALKLGASEADAQRLLPRGAQPVRQDDPAARTLAGRAQIKRLIGARALTKVQTPQLKAALEVAVRYALADEATAMVSELRTRLKVPPVVRFEAAMLAVGLASDESIALLLEGVEAAPAYAVAARYHRARALERMQRAEEAAALYESVRADDRRDPRYYAMWADLRLWALRNEQLQGCTTELSSENPRAVAGPVFPPTAMSSAARRDMLLPKLVAVADQFGDAYPWLGRAADLVALELFEDAADEVGEAYLAWRDARGELRLRSGLEAVLTGEAPARHVADATLRKARLSLDKGARELLAEVADELGDPGVALRFRDVRGEMRPRAYADAVQRAADKYGVDPNLLFAVMRVESIYHRQIVSYAGAVGLMQIMPRTGMLIARKLGVERFNVRDLLDPQTNVEFAAWYLSSLIKRFDGRLPLAIAAYNGGPHNVRLWMREGHPDMPLEAFLERIPFSQTHRYVRRVLTHYAAYRAQLDLPMERLHVDLPEARPDSVAF